MTKIIMMITIILFMLSLYLNNEKLKKIQKILSLISFISIFASFQNFAVVVDKQTYLYGKSDFDKYASYAQASMRETGVYASLTLAQAAQEQGLTPPVSNNMFGIKASKGDPCVNLKTKEQTSDGKEYSTVACFKKYDSFEESFVDHGKWLINTFANRNEFRQAETLESQLKSLTSNPRARYATALNYLCSLQQIINQFDLTKYDEGITYSGRGITIHGSHINKVQITGGCSSSGYNGGTLDSGSTGSNYKLDIDDVYDGEIKDGYLFKRLKEDSLSESFDEDILAKKLEEGEANNIIAEIYGRVVTGLNYNNGIDSSVGQISASLGGIDAGEASTWRQGDSRWKSIHLGSSSATIGSAGCAATSVAIQISRSGVSLSQDFNLNPGSFVQYLNSVGGFTSGGAIYWAKASNLAPSFKYVEQISVNPSNVLSTIASYLSDSSYYLVMHIYGSKHHNTTNHWMAVTGVTNNDIYMIDPSGRGTSVEEAYGVKYVNRISVYKVG